MLAEVACQGRIARYDVTREGNGAYWEHCPWRVDRTRLHVKSRIMRSPPSPRSLQVMAGGAWMEIVGPKRDHAET